MLKKIVNNLAIIFKQNEREREKKANHLNSSRFVLRVSYGSRKVIQPAIKENIPKMQ
jgi:hypothetical protein